jgi:large subunit ribosomal protein L15
MRAVGPRFKVAATAPWTQSVFVAPEDVKLNTLRDVPGARKAKTRLGRGQASGQGTQAGKGHKGHKARGGSKTPTLFEGGQSHLALRVRKYGFSNSMFKVDYNEVSLDRIQRFVDQGRLDTSGTITMKRLVDSGVVRRIRQGLKLLSNGKETFAAKIDIEVTAASAAAKEAVEKAGGKVTTVYLNRLGMLTHLRKDPSEIAIRFARAPPDMYTRFDVPKYPSPIADARYAKLEQLEKVVAEHKLATAAVKD